MLTYILKRIAYSIFPLFGVSIIGFVLFRVMPGDPALFLVGIGATQQQIDAVRAAIGENLPLYQQYFIWLKDVLTGNFGTSLYYNQPVTSVILQRLPATIELVIFAVIIALILGVGIGVFSALRENTKGDTIARSFSYIAFGIPDFVWGLIFILIFGAYLRVLPVSGEIDPFINLHQVTGYMIVDSVVTGNIVALFSVVQHLILPGLALALVLTAIIQRTVRSSMIDVLREDYIVTDRMKGLSERYIVFVRALKNAMIPALTILGVQFTFLMGGSIVIELIFGWPGLGSMIFTAISYKDLPLVQAVVMFYALVVVIVNIVVDLLYSYFNPKIRYGR
ncbi:MAG: ABC transporter permease [Thaumarchaeota archaeon]|nr:ABC transporter permease [Nitrososphaerota archaeon]